MDRLEQQFHEIGYTPSEALAVLRAAAAARLTAADLTTALLPLAEAGPTASDTLSNLETAFFARHCGLPPTAGGGRPPADLAILRLASALQLTRDSLTVAQAATQLGLLHDDVRDRISARTLYGYPIGGQLLLPRWQFRDGGVLPHLTRLLSGLPLDAHPMTVTGFMTTPSDELAGQTPVQWLAGDRDPTPVAFALSALTIW